MRDFKLVLDDFSRADRVNEFGVVTRCLFFCSVEFHVLLEELIFGRGI